ncbi:MAG: Multidrug resistance protein MdtA [Fimbriimonadaceae bacterium]|nr:Multidrug resistance protein MdtA [Fimbriimonadaceae bacterium]
MKRFVSIVVICASVGVFAQEEEPGHMHGPDGRHIVAPQASGGSQKFILSHHDMRIEGADGKIILGCKVDSTIYRKGDPKDVIHTEHNAYEPENEVYGSHMTYKEPGEYVISQAVTLPDGKKTSVEFPVYVPAISAAATEAEHEHGPNYPLIIGGIVGGLLLLLGVYKLGQKNSRIAGAGLALLILAGGSLAQFAQAQQEEAGHMHGPDGRHIVAPDAAKSAGPMLKAYPASNQGESAEKVVDGIKFVLSIENEEMTPDPDLVAIGQEQANLIGLKTASVQLSSTAGGLQTTGQVSANPNGMVVVNARASGRILSLGALPGTTVSRGTTLAVIESPELGEAQAAYKRAVAEVVQANASVKIAQSGITAAETRLNVAQRTSVRQRQLAATGAFASPSLEAAKSALSKAEKDVSAAETSVRSLEVRVRQLEQGVASGVVARRELEAARAELETAKSGQTDAQRQLRLANEALAREESITAKGLRNAKEVDLAQSEVDIARSVLASSRNGLLQARADLSRAQSMVRVARDQIALLGGGAGGGNRVVITAPISGEVERRSVSAGQTVAVGQELYELLNADVVWVLSDVYEADIPKVRIGQKVEVVADALPGRTYPGEVAFVHNEVDEKTRTTKVRIVVGNPGERLKQNMFVRVQLGTGGRGQTLVPTAAVQTTGGVSVVFVEEVHGTYRRTVVQTGGTLGDRTIVLSGLEPGKKVVTDGAYQLAGMAGAR